MTLQSQSQFTIFDTDFGRGQTYKVPPVSRYAPGANPYHPLQSAEAYAEAWRESLRIQPKPEVDQDQRASMRREKYVNALREKSPQTVMEIAESCGVSVKTAGSMVLTFEQDGILRRCGVTGRRAVLWELERGQ